MIITHDYLKSLEGNVITGLKYKAEHIVKYRCINPNGLIKQKFFKSGNMREFNETSKVMYVNITGKNMDDFALDVDGNPFGGCRRRCTDTRITSFPFHHVYSILARADTDTLFIVRSTPSAKLRIESYSDNHFILDSICFEKLW